MSFFKTPPLPIIIGLNALMACSLISCNPQSSQFALKTTNSTPEPASLTTEAQPSNIQTIMKTNEEWKEVLSPKAYHILREHGTERPFGPDYKKFKKISDGGFHCAGCDLLLFEAKTSFDSRSGWPSFWKPAQDQNVKVIEDLSLGMKRMEVRCARCDGHLGHVFEGEGFGNPTDLRYCINAGALKHESETQ